jgi:hypothetical protein
MLPTLFFASGWAIWARLGLGRDSLALCAQACARIQYTQASGFEVLVRPVLDVKAGCIDDRDYSKTLTRHGL